MVRGEVFRLPSPRGALGREQRGARHAVDVQADEFLDLSTVIVAPTSTLARPASFRPLIDLAGTMTKVLVEQVTVVDPRRLGRSASRLAASELRAVDEALALVLGLGGIPVRQIPACSRKSMTSRAQRSGSSSNRKWRTPSSHTSLEPGISCANREA